MHNTKLEKWKVRGMNPTARNVDEFVVALWIRLSSKKNLLLSRKY